MKIAFHSYQLGGRGTEIALYKYAKYNKEILGNESIIVSTNSRPSPTLKRFENEFKVVLYPDVWISDGKNDSLRNTLENICDKEKIDIFYALKGGENDGILPSNVNKTLSHAIFIMDQPHGDIYCGVSQFLAKKFNKDLYLDHIVENESHTNEDLREILNIPKDAIVFGRHGGSDTFDLDFVHKNIIEILNIRSDIYFIFLGTNPFFNHKNIKYINWTSSIENKTKFINTCDAMLHARYIGETFGLSVAEFSIKNKPVLTWKPTIIPDHYDIAHIDILKEKAIYYTSGEDLFNILKNISKKDFVGKNWDAYTEDFCAKKIMLKFKSMLDI